MKSRALLLVVSPHVSGASAALGTQLILRLPAERWETRTLHVYPALRSADAWQELCDAVHHADLIVLSAPLYVDALPAAVTLAMERLVESAGTTAHAGRRLAAIVNCGYPEGRQADVALQICRLFAREAGFEWAGGLGVGGAGRMARDLPAALDMAAAALDGGNPVPPAAAELLRKSVPPAWPFALAGSLFMWLEARKHGAHWRIGARPYEPSAREGRG